MHRLVSRPYYSFSKKVGFVGLGNMGLPMATNLAKKGFTVAAFDIDKNKKADVEKHGIKFFTEVRDLASQAESFVTMLPNSEHSKDVCLSAGGNAACI